jgi:hypothetical protein
MAGVSHPAKTFTPKQGQYLAFIDAYTACISGRLRNGKCNDTSA